MSDLNGRSFNSTGIFLDRIGEFDLLTAEEEVDLAKKMEVGKAAEEQLDSLNGEIGEDSKEALASLAAEGQEAKELFINSNHRLVASVARRYIDNGLDFDDLQQHGAFGLQRAVEKFDYRKGFKFSTYATWWIRQSITRGLAKSLDIKIPANAFLEYNTVNFELIEIEKSTKESLIPEKRSEIIRDSIEHYGLSITPEVFELIDMGRPASLDAPINESGDELKIFLRDNMGEATTTADEIENFDTHMSAVSVVDKIRRQLHEGGLDADELMTIYGMRAGVIGDDIMTAKEITEELYGTTRTKIMSDKVGVGRNVLQSAISDGRITVEELEDAGVDKSMVDRFLSDDRIPIRRKPRH